MPDTYGYLGSEDQVFQRLDSEQCPSSTTGAPHGGLGSIDLRSTVLYEPIASISWKSWWMTCFTRCPSYVFKQRTPCFEAGCFEPHGLVEEKLRQTSSKLPTFRFAKGVLHVFFVDLVTQTIAGVPPWPQQLVIDHDPTLTIINDRSYHEPSWSIASHLQSSKLMK